MSKRKVTTRVVAMVIVLVMTVILIPIGVMADPGAPFISLVSEREHHVVWEEYENNAYANPTELKEMGVEYDEETKTVTLENIDSDCALQFGNVGEDITLKLIGQNRIDNLQVYAIGASTGVTIVGDGTLETNQISISVDGDLNAFLHISNTPTVVTGTGSESAINLRGEKRYEPSDLFFYDGQVDNPVSFAKTDNDYEYSLQDTLIRTFSPKESGEGTSEMGDIHFIGWNIWPEFEPSENASEEENHKGKYGITYDANSNTLTFNNVDIQKAVEDDVLFSGNLHINNMGRDFKINLIGNNNLGWISIYSDETDTTVEIVGNGTLNTNEIYLTCYDGYSSKFIISDTATVVVKNDYIDTDTNTAGSAIEINSDKDESPTELLVYRGKVDKTLEFLYTEGTISRTDIDDNGATFYDMISNVYSSKESAYTFSPVTDNTKPTKPTEPMTETDDGKGTSALNGLVKGSDGLWAMYESNKVQTSYNGLAKNENGWYDVKDGYVAWDYTGFDKNVETGTWWRVKDGRVDFTADGIYKKPENGVWYKTTDGKVSFNETGVFKNENGWWRVKDSRVDFQADGIYKNQNGWWKTTNGRVTFNENGVFKNENGWWKVKNSKVDFNFTGIASNKNGTWYLKNGKVDFSKTGKVTYNGKTYTVKNGKVQ